MKLHLLADFKNSTRPRSSPMIFCYCKITVYCKILGAHCRKHNYCQPQNPYFPWTRDNHSYSTRKFSSPPPERTITSTTAVCLISRGSTITTRVSLIENRSSLAAHTPFPGSSSLTFVLSSVTQYLVDAVYIPLLVVSLRHAWSGGVGSFGAEAHWQLGMMIATSAKAGASHWQVLINSPTADTRANRTSRRAMRPFAYISSWRAKVADREGEIDR